MTQYNSFWEAAPAVLGTAALAGGAVRISKGLIDVFRRSDPESAPVDIDKTEDPIVGLEMPVSHEEAAQLRAKGVKVKKHAFSLDDYNVGAAGAFALGALGTGAAIAGWKGTDYLVNSYRKARAEEKRDAIKNRIKNILNDMPDNEDTAIHAHMKAAEAIYLHKEGSSFFWDPSTQLVDPLAALLGGGLTVAGIKAYNQAVAAGEEPGKIKALKGYLKKMKVRPPMATVVPVEEADQPGSPAEQASSQAA